MRDPVSCVGAGPKANTSRIICSDDIDSLCTYVARLASSKMRKVDEELQRFITRRIAYEDRYR